ncbi:hypothetical protein ACQYWQ_07070 [Streptomyces sp. P6-2-1]|uniref:hypothetical protein n=1 Tax=Streptomyces sp. P6-2-1 TaxID=3422591 RepID=UPI003D36F9D1
MDSGEDAEEGDADEGEDAEEGDADEEEDAEEGDDEDEEGPSLDLVTPYGPVSLARIGAPRLEPGPGPVRLRGELVVGGHGTGGDPLPLRAHRMWVRCEPKVPDGEGRLMPDPDKPPYLREVTAPPAFFADPEPLLGLPDDADTRDGLMTGPVTGYLPGIDETGILVEAEPLTDGTEAPGRSPS